MKTTKWLVRFCMAALLLAGAGPGRAEAAEVEPYARIKSARIEKTNIVVEVEASANFTKVTLESSTRVGRRAWEPRAVKLMNDLEAASANVTFTLPISPALEILRVRADLVENSLPTEFYTGTNKFTNVTTAGGVAAGAGDGTSAPTREGDANAGGGSSRTVVESDIWKLEGDTLFFFNQYRGLQVINVAAPEDPVVTGTYDLAGAGEQMFVINGTNVVLLARDNCSWYGTESQSRIVLLQLRAGVPHLVKELAVPGNIAESRLVGSALYVVANSYQKRTITRDTVVSEQWEWGSEVLSFDLNDFATAQQKSREWVSGYGNVIMATDQFLFVSQTIYENSSLPYKSTIFCFDISSPTGEFTRLSSFSAGGTVIDKFKMHMMGNTFVAVVQLNDWRVNLRATYVNTFSLADPRAPQKLASLKIIENEQLFATRFDGDLLYAVTFFVIDPLWIIDLSDPAAPKKVGELHIPGWSTYLHPLGDKLLAIGMDQTNGSRRTSVQLFDVANPANPALLSKVLIGDQWSGSEANWDEKAFGVLPEEKLVLVPFTSSGTNGYFEGVQLIDLETDHLVKRGVVEHKMGARRATLHRERLLSISSRELLSVDATDRDKPEVVNSLQLSWAADRVHLVGDYVIEVDSNGNEGPILRVVDANEPSMLQSFLRLTNLPYMGSVEANGKLYVLQGRSVEYVYPKEYNPTNYYPIATNPAVYLFTEVKLGNLPELQLGSVIRKEGKADYFYGQYQPLQVTPDLLVWANKGHGYGWWGPVIYDLAVGGPAGAADMAVRPGIIAPWPWWGGSSGHFIAVDISKPTPAFASELTLSSTNGWWNFSDAYTANGLLYTSHQANEFDPAFDPPPYTYLNWNGTSYVTVTNDPPPGAWVTRYFLDVIDFADAEQPLVRKPVNIPGSLIGIHRGGELLFTRGTDFERFYYTGNENIAASSYDGVSAHLIDSLLLDYAWPRPSLSDSGYVYIGASATTNNPNATLQVWTLSEAGKLVQVSSETLSSPAQQLEKIDSMVVAQSNEIEIFDAQNPADLTLIGTGQASVCYGVLLDGADGENTRGLWVPVGWYGVIKIPVGTKP